MRKKTLILYILLLPVLAVFVLGMTKLLILRYEAGDVYPAYSSLRPDPLGTRALYEGIDNVRGISARRKYQPVTKLEDIQETTLLYIGIAPSYFRYMDNESVNAFEKIISAGNRVIMSFYPAQRGSFWREEEEEEEGEEEEDKREEEHKEDASTQDQIPDEYSKKPDSLTERWGINFRYTKLQDRKDTPAKLAGSFRKKNSFTLPDAISWHTTLYFEILEKDVWRITYTRNGHPVIVERDFGKGTIVLSADSYFLSNEAMHKERHPELLAWLLDSCSNVIFDETHFGVIGTTGIATLIRKYRLEWFVAGLVFLAALFVWKSAFSFVPPPRDTTIETTTSDKDLIEGLINLLRRNISSKDIISVCFDEWKKSFSHTRKISEKTREEILAVVEAEKARPGRDRNPVECYRTISKILGESGK